MDLEETIREYKEKAYIECQEASGLKVGDKVKVLRIVEDHEDGWTNGWVPEMDSMVGTICTITSINEFGGVSLSGKGRGNWGFPFFVLEKVPPAMFEVLASDGKWKKSLNRPEDIKGYEQLNFDDDYKYSHCCGLLYRIKKE